MNTNKVKDTTFNLIIPLILGGIIYLYKPIISNHFIKNYLSDGLWAYALVNSILIIWNREIKILYVFFCLLLCVFYETLQYLKIANGTADIFDILIYIFSIIIAFILNKKFKKQFYVQN